MVGIFRQFQPFFLWSSKWLENQTVNKRLENPSVFPTEKYGR